MNKIHVSKHKRVVALPVSHVTTDLKRFRQIRKDVDELIADDKKALRSNKPKKNFGTNKNETYLGLDREETKRFLKEVGHYASKNVDRMSDEQLHSMLEEEHYGDVARFIKKLEMGK